MGQTFCALWMRSGAFRALQVRVREEQRNRTPVTLHLGLVCHLCACQVSEMFPASPWCMVWHPSSWAAGEPWPSMKPCEELSFIKRSLRLWKLLVSDAG